MTICNTRRRKLGAAALLLALAGCDSGSDREPPAASVVDTTDLGTVETYSAVTGRDVGASALFQGRSVWIYGDTFLANPDELNRTLLSNTWSWTYDMDASDGLGGFLEPLDSVAAPQMLLPETEAEQEFNDEHAPPDCVAEPCGARWALWPSSIVEDLDRDRALVFYSLVYARPGEWNFSGVGNSIAVWEDVEQPPERPMIDPLADYPTLMFQDDEPAFGSAALIHGDLLYVFGCKKHDEEKPCKLARVGLDHVFDRAHWEYFAGDGWSSNIGTARTVFDGNDMMSVSWNSYLGRYIAVYSNMLSNRVMMRTAASIEGPWSSEEELFVAEKPLDGGYVYDALAHPEYSRDDGRIIYVTYTRATGDFTREMRLVSVELAKKMTP